LAEPCVVLTPISASAFMRVAAKFNMNAPHFCDADRVSLART
jgi:hypothetical protein